MLRYAPLKSTALVRTAAKSAAKAIRLATAPYVEAVVEGCGSLDEAAAPASWRLDIPHTDAPPTEVVASTCRRRRVKVIPPTVGRSAPIGPTRR